MGSVVHCPHAKVSPRVSQQLCFPGLVVPPLPAWFQLKPDLGNEKLVFISAPRPPPSSLFLLVLLLNLPQRNSPKSFPGDQKESQRYLLPRQGALRPCPAKEAQPHPVTSHCPYPQPQSIPVPIPVGWKDTRGSVGTVAAGALGGHVGLWGLKEAVQVSEGLEEVQVQEVMMRVSWGHGVPMGSPARGWTQAEAPKGSSARGRFWMGDGDRRVSGWTRGRAWTQQWCPGGAMGAQSTCPQPRVSRSWLGYQGMLQQRPAVPMQSIQPQCS